MASYKLTEISTFCDNEEAAEPQYLQGYVDNIAEDIIDNWDTADVTLVVNDADTYTSYREGNRHAATGPSRLAYHPWHKATVERPETEKDVKLLGWFDTGSTAYDFDIIKFRVRDGEFCDRNGHPLMTDKLWWRTLEKPIKEG